MQVGYRRAVWIVAVVGVHRSSQRIPQAVDEAFSIEIDFAQLVKIHGAPRDGAVRYSPASFKASRREVIIGDSDPAHISTSFVERQNLTMRMSMRRFTRLTNGFSKKAANHAHALSLHYLHYNFARAEDAPRHASNAGGPCESRLVAGRNRWPLGQT